MAKSTEKFHRHSIHRTWNLGRIVHHGIDIGAQRTAYEWCH